MPNKLFSTSKGDREPVRHACPSRNASVFRATRNLYQIPAVVVFALSTNYNVQTMTFLLEFFIDTVVPIPTQNICYLFFHLR